MHVKGEEVHGEFRGKTQVGADWRVIGEREGGKERGLWTGKW